MCRTKKTQSHVRSHFIRRLQERYGIRIPKTHWDQLNLRCTEETLLVVESNTRCWHRLLLEGVTVYCCYQHRYGLTTCLTEEQYLKSFGRTGPAVVSRGILNQAVQLVLDVLKNLGGRSSRTALKTQTGLARTLLDTAVGKLKQEGALMLQGDVVEWCNWDSWGQAEAC